MITVSQQELSDMVDRVVVKTLKNILELKDEDIRPVVQAVIEQLEEGSR